jgi:benzoate/toluate 1,2-dioxygenase beta subunit
MTALASSISFDLYQQVLHFLHEEARLLDAGKLDQWLELYTQDAVYWIPSQPGQTDALTVPSILYEDRSLLAMRVRRLTHPRAYSAQPVPRTMHLIGNIEVFEQAAEKHEWRVNSKLLVAEHQGGRSRYFAGDCAHVIRRQGDTLQISFKRVDLIDCDRVGDRAISILI